MVSMVTKLLCSALTLVSALYRELSLPTPFYPTNQARRGGPESPGRRGRAALLHHRRHGGWRGGARGRPLLPGRRGATDGHGPPLKRALKRPRPRQLRPRPGHHAEQGHRGPRRRKRRPRRWLRDRVLTGAGCLRLAFGMLLSAFFKATLLSILAFFESGYSPPCVV